MNALRLLLRSAAVLFLAGSLAQAAPISGTVTNKTTGKPSAGDKVALIDVQASMAEVSSATTDANGHYTLSVPSNTPHLIRVTHQGAPYFIAAPENGGPGDLSVFDVAAKVDAVFIEADVYEIEASNDTLHVTEHFYLHNQSNPPRTMWNPHTFEIVLPANATITSAATQRPNSTIPTSVKLDPVGAKGHYAFATPIEPDNGEKDTHFQVAYDLPYSGGKFTFHSQVTLPAQNVGVLIPTSMSFTAGSGSTFQAIKQDPGVQTFVLRNAVPSQTIEFTISGTGSMPREQQNDGGQQTAANAGQPGGGIGQPIATPDPLSKYKWWILGALALLLTAGAAFLLRKPAGAAGVSAPATDVYAAPAAVHAAPVSAAGKNAALLNVLKEELFALESEKLAGTLTPGEYVEVKSALEVVLKRALKRNT
jgi:hypothetical protein